MKINLKAANDKFVTAENGGGISGLVSVAMRANRAAVGPWETIVEAEVGDSLVTLQTDKGFYITSERDGRISTDRRSVGKWETWQKVTNGYVSWQGKYLCCELSGIDPYLVANRNVQGPWETFLSQVTGGLQLTVLGTSFLLDGKPIKLKGFSSFALLKRYIDGNDITHQLQEMEYLGVLVPRIFCRCENLFSLDPPYYHDYFVRLNDLTSLLNSKGLIPEYVVLADCASIPAETLQTFVTNTADVLKNHSCLFELVNEFDTQWQRVNPLSYSKPAGVISSRGSGASGSNPSTPAWDYSTFHNRRDEKWLITIPKDSEAIINGFPGYAGTHCPIYYNEPKGFASSSRGDRSSSPKEAFVLGAMLSLWTAGGVFHSDNGRLSYLLDEVETNCAKEFYRGLSIQ